MQAESVFVETSGTPTLVQCDIADKKLDAAILRVSSAVWFTRMGDFLEVSDSDRTQRS
ncbi:hypothetical protein NC997_01105 [Trichocoleus sp. DQ-A2]|uniref:hypothetical protein n=1 Tax=Trichocoleus sp. DQ-A2 TaxID=2933924 RepID=UPI0019B1EFBF|nr:hypothetical protein [Coleofasciculus sp. FACHB-T130]